MLLSSRFHGGLCGRCMPVIVVRMTVVGGVNTIGGQPLGERFRTAKQRGCTGSFFNGRRIRAGRIVRGKRERLDSGATYAKRGDQT